MTDADHDGIFLHLKYSLQLLACTADTQLGLLPDFVCKGDELALDFDNWQGVVRGRYAAELTDTQRSILIGIDEQFSAITAWSDEDVRTASEWEEVRKSARQALNAFGWPLEVPPSELDE